MTQPASTAPLPTSPSSSESGARTPAWRVEISRRERFGDPVGLRAGEDLRELGIVTARVRSVRGILLSPGYGAETVQEIARSHLADPVVDVVRITPPAPARGPAEPAEDRERAPHRIHVLRRPGVSDPVARTIEGLLEHTQLLPAEGSKNLVATYRSFEIDTETSSAELARAAAKAFANPTIEILRMDDDPLPYGIELPSSRRGRVEVALCRAGAGELEALSLEGGLALDLTEMEAIQDHFVALQREPTACELETIAQTWSEHCKHKTLTGICEFHPPDGGAPERIDNLLKETIVRATRELDRDFCVSVFVDNAGIIAFDRGFDLCIKVETHNHPSALDPYGGAGTGIGGVIRDILGAGRGSFPIANTDCFFVGPQDLPPERIPKGALHPRRILRGVVAGVRDYGNRMGIPTVNGGVWFDERYTANPLVFCGTLGLLPHEFANKEVRPGDLIVTVGGRTGRDGIHGATFSSIELSEDSDELSSSAVQIGDPIAEKRVLDGLMIARDRGLYRGITDCGAGGFSSAVGEMGEACGAEVDLERAPLKYAGLASHEVWISEAQERMVLGVPPEKLDELIEVFAEEDVEASVIGRFTDTGKLVLHDDGELVGELDMHFLHQGAPRPLQHASWTPPEEDDPGCPPCTDHGAMLDALLRAPNVRSKEWIIRQYDHEVQGRSVIKPLVGLRGDGPGDAACLKPLDESQKGAVIACGANPLYGESDPEAMTLAAIDEALRNAVCVGADPDHACLLDNFSWGDCSDPNEMGALVLTAKACYRGAMAYRTPFVSGKDSLNNTYRVGDEIHSIPKTLLITALAVAPDVERCLTMDLKATGNLIYLVGETAADLGGSHYLLERKLRGGRVPRPDLERAPGLLRALARAIAERTVASAHDLSEGGLAVAAAEMCLAGDRGLALDLAQVPVAGGQGAPPAGAEACDPDALRLYSESCTRFLVEVPPADREAFETALRGFPYARLGRVRREPRLQVRGVSGTTLFESDVAELRRAFTSSPQALPHSPPV
ncbi:MAG: phosphoribosylformylglycinamidine synthase subunit PurL [Planctomycetes bacterium]|jgi:phosphoribosylformylglycinamidine synthase|nr:phosphoribosylformylglycinamidine synthase subunit PurL [Planctomycetota bacterium]